MDIDAPDYLATFPVQGTNDKPKAKNLNRNQHGGRPSKRRDILQYAIELAVEQGPKGFTIDALCERAGISKGGIFYHFASVNELVHEMFIFYLNISLPQWIKTHALFAGKSNIALSDMSIEEFTYLVEHAPMAANLERLVFKTTIESSQPPQATEFLRKLIEESSPAQKIALYSVFGARIARVFELPGATPDK